MFIVPIGTQRIAERGIPMLTVGMCVLLIGVFGLTISSLDRDVLAEAEAAEAAALQYYAAPYTLLPEDVLKTLPNDFKARYERNRRWTQEYFANPDEGRRIADAFGKNLGLALAAKAGGTGGAEPARGLSEAADKSYFMSDIVATTEEGRSAAQEEMDRLAAQYREIRKGSLARRVGYTPAEPSIRGLLSHLFVHSGWWQLAFSLLFFVPAAASLEDKWKPGAFFACILVSAAAGAVANGMSAPGSDTPLLGLGGAVAGLYGAFLMRLWHEDVRFFYVYFLGLSPRYGTFAAPAGVMIGLWILGELLYAWVFAGSSGTAHWAHVGGFAMGAVLAVVFRVFGLERPHEERSSPSVDGPSLRATAVAKPMGLLAQDQQRKLGLRSSSRNASNAPSEPSVLALERGNAYVALESLLDEPALSPPRGSPIPTEPESPVFVIRLDAEPEAAVVADSEPDLGFDMPESDPQVSFDLPDVGVTPMTAATPPPALPPVVVSTVSAVQASTAPTSDLESLPGLPVPQYSVSFRLPDRGPPEASFVDAALVALPLAAAIRTDDNPTIVSAFVRACSKPLPSLEPTESWRLARALAEMELPGHAVQIARRATNMDPSGPYASRLFLLEARVLHARGLDRERVQKLVATIRSRFPGDPVQTQLAGLG